LRENLDKIPLWKSINNAEEENAMTLHGQLESALVRWPRGTDQFFIPVDAQDRLLIASRVATEFERLFPNLAPAERLSYVTKTCSLARKLFAILLLIDKGMSILDFLADGITDKDLPLVQYPKESATSSYTLRTEGRINSPISAIENWSRLTIRLFYREQWGLKAPVFEMLGKHYELEDDCVLPFVEDRGNNIENVNTGGYSEVWGVRIHSAHQRIFKSTNAMVRASRPLTYNLSIG
jgi:hypothetical protein